MQEIILNRICEDNNNNNNQHKNNKFFDNQINRNQQFNKVCYFNKLEKNNNLNNYFNTQTSNKCTYAKMKNKNIIIVLNIINRNIIIEIVQRKINKASQI